MTRSTDASTLDAEIRRLQALKHEAEEREARERCIAIFGDCPKDYSEDMFATVARVYVLRGFKRDDLRQKYLPDHEWIKLWHEHEPKATVHELYEDAMAYVEGGCGISG